MTRHPGRRRLVGTGVGVALIIASLAGCGQDPSGPSADPPPTDPGPHNSWDVSQMPDPCRTVTHAEVAAVLVDPVRPGVRLESWPPLCMFTMPGPPEEFLYVSDDSRPEAKEDFERQRSDSPDTRTVPGIGDQAYWQGQFNALHVFSGATHLTVKFAGPKTPADTRAKATAVARIALPRATKVGP